MLFGNLARDPFVNLMPLGAQPVYVRLKLVVALDRIWR